MEFYTHELCTNFTLTEADLGNFKAMEQNVLYRICMLTGLWRVGIVISSPDQLMLYDLEISLKNGFVCN